MKRLTFLPILLLSLVLSSCHLVDDEIDLPVPVKPVEEMLVGDWGVSEIVYTRYDEDGNMIDSSTEESEAIYDFSKTNLFIFYPQYTYEKDYKVYKQNRKTYVAFGDKVYDPENDTNYYPYQEHEIVSITDETMRWLRTRNTSIYLSDGSTRQVTETVETRFNHFIYE